MTKDYYKFDKQKALATLVFYAIIAIGFIIYLVYILSSVK